MSKKNFLFFNLYLIILALFVYRKVDRFFTRDSVEYLYLQILRDFDIGFYLTYYLNFMQICFSVIQLFPILFFIYQIRLFSQKFWQWLFVFKIIFDITGHPYEIKYLTSLYYYHPSASLIVFLSSIATYVPSYVVWVRYAFQKINTNT